MEDYRSNSNKSKEPAHAEQIDEHRVKSVVTKPTKKKKKSGIRRMGELIVPEDMNNVKSYVFFDVLLPALKKTLYDVISNGSHMMLFGSSGKTERRTSYSSYYSNRKEEPSYSYSKRSSFDFNDIVISDRDEAESVIRAMEDLLDRYHLVRVADVYDLLDMSSSSNWTDNRYGWTDISGARVVSDYDGYRIKLPRPLPLD